MIFSDSGRFPPLQMANAAAAAALIGQTEFTATLQVTRGGQHDDALVDGRIAPEQERLVLRTHGWNPGDAATTTPEGVTVRCLPIFRIPPPAAPPSSSLFSPPSSSLPCLCSLSDFFLFFLSFPLLLSH